VSLRDDIHDGFDELGSGTHGLEDRVLAAVAGSRPRAAVWSVRLRAPMSVIAAVLAIALVVVALMGGRLAADWRTFTAPHQATPSLSPLQKLEARPLRLHTVRSMTDCPNGPWDKNGDLGIGPLHTSGSAVETRTAWGSYFHNVVFADGPVKGPFLLRALDLISGDPIVFVGEYAAGPVVRSDVLDGHVVEQHRELFIASSVPPYSWEFESGMANTSHCFGFQVDGPDFTETFSLR